MVVYCKNWDIYKRWKMWDGRCEMEDGRYGMEDVRWMREG